MRTYKVYFKAVDTNGKGRSFMIWLRGSYLHPYVPKQRAYDLADALASVSKSEYDNTLDKILNEK